MERLETFLLGRCSGGAIDLQHEGLLLKLSLSDPCRSFQKALAGIGQVRAGNCLEDHSLPFTSPRLNTWDTLFQYKI